ncbi:disulfide bond formation protein DsbA [Nocardioides guangzhouensis]|uniref:Disulfide bond formation protein DsbA n=1 Tax=Nocardioides guangzhouensis TaxID=2497878 RepID=A0A4Q4ZL13_9ACTN|nr:thioredoxin domain-containing protein [Nocardioides guangzhouensis]RYP89043.1 disulfide bond formation protein DsbA [Nocardioides guangzhouensis]
MKTKPRNGLVALAVVVVLAIVVGVGVAVQASRDTTGNDGATPGGSSSSSTPDGSTTGNGAVQAGLAEKYGLGVGDPNAPVKVEIFEDFLCPYCGQLEAISHEKLQQAAADGKVYVVYRPMAFLGDYSTRAFNAFGVVLDEAGGEAALRFHNELYADQPSEGGAMPDDDWLVRKAVAAGADEAAVRKGIEDGSFQQWTVNANDDASRRGVNSTPTVFVNGESVSATSIEDLDTQVMQRIQNGS